MISADMLLAGRYRLLSRLGSGGHGEVWRAQDTLLERVVAVKTVRAALADNPEFTARFHAEARSMATIDHPGVVGVFDFGIAEMPGGRTPYLVMQYLDGEPLHLLLSRRGRVAAGPTMELVAQAAAALQASHEAGVVHRDVKPGNLMIRPDGTVALTDFGIARTAEGLQLTATGIVLGTATYCAPEQAEGSAPTPAMDVYALGVVAYECLAGRVPFEGENAVAIALKHLHEEPPPLPDDVPAGVREVVVRAMAKDPAARWPSASALAAAARALADGVDAPMAGLSGVDGGTTATPRTAAPVGPPHDSASAGPPQDTATVTPPRDSAPAGPPQHPTPTGSRQHPTPTTARQHPAPTAARQHSMPTGAPPGSASADPPGGSVSADPHRGSVSASRSTAEASGEGSRREQTTGVRGARRTRRGVLMAGGGLAAAAAAIAAAVAWTLLQPSPPPTTAAQSRAGETLPSTAPEPVPNPKTDAKDGEPRDTPTTPDTSQDPDASANPDPSADPSTDPDPSANHQGPKTGLLVGGIVHVGKPSPGSAATDGYQPGMVEVFTDKGRRVAGKRSEQSGFRFSLPQGGYRLQTAVGDETCSTTAQVKLGKTTRADLKCTISPPPASEPAFQSASIKDKSGDAKGGPNAGKPPLYADLLAAVVRGGKEGATAEFTTAGTVPTTAPSEVRSRSAWTVSVEQDGKTATLSLTGAKDTWTLHWAAKDNKTDQVSAAAKPTISGARISVALGHRAPLKTAPIDFAKPYRIVGAGSNVIHALHGWTDAAP
ncbi:protein kinase domain-containing protein [Nonomuraea sp. KM90]|uniref:protein kinase domain-containing protein n=1 Tax=Nonomuraea sp. KM90 TaxID=3457428 RepID=UPI003FCEC79D